MVASPDKMTETVGTDALGEYVKSRGGSLPIRKVLIANNGMAATKSILSMRQWAYMELGDEKAIQFVAMATPEDLNANAEFVRLGENPPKSLDPPSTPHGHDVANCSPSIHRPTNPPPPRYRLASPLSLSCCASFSLRDLLTFALQPTRLLRCPAAATRTTTQT